MSMQSVVPPATSPVDLRLAPRVLADVGAHLAAATVALQREPGLSHAALQGLAALEQLGLELQQLVHALVPVPPERCEALDLLDLLQRVAAERRPALDAQGLRVQIGGQPAGLEMDPALLEQAIGLLIEHAGALGARQCLLSSVPAWGEQSVALWLDEVDSGLALGLGAQELHLQLLRLLARAHGWRLHCVAAPAGVGGRQRLVLELARRQSLAPQVEDVLPRSRLPAALRVLVIDPQPASREQACRLLRDAGLLADAALDLQQAEQALLDGEPAAIVLGLPADAPDSRQFIDSLDQRLPGLRWVELVDAPNVYQTSMPGSARPARLSRDDLAHTLLPTLAQELAL